MLLFASPAPPGLTLEVNGLALWTADLAAGKITVKSRLAQNPQETAMNNNTKAGPVPVEKPTAQPGLSPGSLDALEVKLSLELEERRISVGELAALAPGQTLETSVSLEGPVTLKVGAQTVGRGRLVAVGDRLGVLISSLGLEQIDNETV
ncbi:hypothetical protein FACS1894205_2470 [Alphaproteobacteria bacterium]|nr:hypothetical protein FACS1894205_2470 [Alphaproteobacteria bacterium]